MQTTFLYNHELFKQRAEFLSAQGVKIPAIAKAAGIDRLSVERACDGRLSTLAKLRRACDAVNLPWPLMFQENISESQFRRAVRGTAR